MCTDASLCVVLVALKLKRSVMAIVFGTHASGTSVYCSACNLQLMLAAIATDCNKAHRSSSGALTVACADLHTLALPTKIPQAE